MSSVLVHLNRPLTASARRFAKATWLTLFGLTTLVLLLGSVNVAREYYDVCASPSRDMCLALLHVDAGWLARYGLIVIALVSILLIAVPWLVMGWFVFRRKSATVSELLLSLGLATGWASDICAHNIRFHFFREASSLLASAPPALIVTYVIGLVSQATIVLIAYLVPDGRFFSRFSVVLALIWVAHVTSNTLYRYPFEAFGDSQAFGALDFVFSLFAPVTMIFVMVQRRRSGSSALQRSQLGAILPSAVTLLVVHAGFSLLTDALWSGEDTTTLTTTRLTAQFVQGLVQSAVAAWFAVSVGLAIARYHLFQIDLALNRTLVYGGLTALLLGLYLMVVFGLGAIFHTSEQVWIPLAATAAIALILLPLRNALRSLASRRLYGGRDGASFEFLSQMTSEFTANLDLDRLADAVRTALRVPYVGIFVDTDTVVGDGSAGGRPDSVRRLPLLVQDTQLGWLEVAFHQGELTDEHEEGLLRKVAEQVAALVQTETLTAALTRSQRDLMATQEKERLRLRRDLHDGLGPALASQSLMAASARRLLESDPRRADLLLGRLEQELASTLEQARHLIYRLRPPELDQLGLSAALRSNVTNLTRDAVAVDYHSNLGAVVLPPAVEVAIYRFVTEAVTNVVRHAQARNCRVELVWTDERGLSVSVSDDGKGIAIHRKGVGLTAMRERVLELGGHFELLSASADGPGTLVRARFSARSLGVAEATAVGLTGTESGE